MKLAAGSNVVALITLIKEAGGKEKRKMVHIIKKGSEGKLVACGKDTAGLIEKVTSVNEAFRLQIKRNEYCQACLDSSK